MADDVVKDETQTDVTDTKTDTSVSDADKSKAESDEKFKAAVEAQESLTSLLEDHGFDSLEDLQEELKSSASLKGKIGSADLEEIMKKANTLEKYEEYWASQKEKEKRSEEEPDDTITRLEREIRELKTNKTNEDKSTKQMQESIKAIESFDSEVATLVDKKEIPENQRDILLEFLGVNNPANEIDITNKVAVRKVTKDGIEKFNKFVSAIQKQSVEDYRAGKLKIPDMSSTETVAPEIGKENIKTLKDARKVMLETLTKHFMGAKSG